MSKTEAERKREQRERDRQAGMVEVTVKVPKDDTNRIRRYAAKLRKAVQAD